MERNRIKSKLKSYFNLIENGVITPGKMAILGDNYNTSICMERNRELYLVSSHYAFYTRWEIFVLVGYFKVVKIWEGDDDDKSWNRFENDLPVGEWRVILFGA